MTIEDLLPQYRLGFRHREPEGRHDVTGRSDLNFNNINIQFEIASR